MDRFWAALSPGDEPLTVFLLITNAALGLFVLGCILLVLRTLFREIILRSRARSFSVTGLGVTLRDGGQSKDPEGRLFVEKDGTISPGTDQPTVRKH